MCKPRVRRRDSRNKLNSRWLPLSPTCSPEATRSPRIVDHQMGNAQVSAEQIEPQDGCENALAPSPSISVSTQSRSIHTDTPRRRFQESLYIELYREVCRNLCLSLSVCQSRLHRHNHAGHVVGLFRITTERIHFINEPIDDSTRRESALTRCSQSFLRAL